MHEWQIGDVRVVRVESVDVALPSTVPVPEWAVPHLAPSVDETFVAFSAFGIIDGDRRIVVDPWLADDGPRNGPGAAAEAERLMGLLHDAGLPTAEIDLVVNTHIDGAGWNTRPDPSGAWVPTFPDARYIFPRGELAAVERGEQIFGAAELVPVFDAGLLDLIDAVRDPVELTPHVTLRAAPGHNFGHLAVHIESDDELAVIPGHLFLDVFSVADPSSRDGDGPEAPATRRQILQLLANREGLLLSPLLGGAGGGRVAGDDRSGYRLLDAGTSSVGG